MNAHLSKIVGEGLTYDDVLLIPAFSEVLTKRSKHSSSSSPETLRLNVPISICCYGHCNRISYGYSHGSRRRDRGACIKICLLNEQAIKG